VGKRNGRIWTKVGGRELREIRKGIYKSNLAYSLNTEMLNTYRRVAHKPNVQNIIFMYDVAANQVAYRNRNW
jgi:hypothetical protein